MAEIRCVRRAIASSLKRQRVFLDRLNPLEVLRDDSDIKARYRFHRATIYSILMLINPDVTNHTLRSHSLPPLLILCVALRFFAGAPFYNMLGDYFHISPASIHRCVKKVSLALKKKASTIIKLPSQNAIPQIKENFYEIAG